MTQPRQAQVCEKAKEHTLTCGLADPFAEADEDTGETKQSQNYIHIRIQRTYLPPTPYLHLMHTATVTPCSTR